MTAKFLELLDLPADAGEDDIISTIASFRAAFNFVNDLGDLFGVQGNVSEVKGALLALHQTQVVASQLQEEIIRLRAEKNAARAKGAVERAIKAGAISPAIRDAARKLAEKDLAGFEALVAGSAPISPERNNFGVPEWQELTVEDTLTADELFIAKNMGITPEQFKASKDELARSESKGYPGDSNVSFRKV